MTDIERAVQGLEGHSICLCLGGELVTDDGRGISPMMRFIAQGRDLRGYSAADLIVGKAAAMLFVKAGVIAVHGRTVSEGGRDFLAAHGVLCTWDELTPKIIDRTGQDICPMEKTVAETDDPDEAYALLTERLARLRKGAV